MAEYWIKKVRFGPPERIDQVLAMQHLGNALGSDVYFRWDQVIAGIRDGHTFFTALAGNVGLGTPTWNKKAQIFVNPFGFLQTRPDNTRRDNLDLLPTF